VIDPSAHTRERTLRPAALQGWWWADPLAGLVIAAAAVQEGREAWRGELAAMAAAEAHEH